MTTDVRQLFGLSRDPFDQPPKRPYLDEERQRTFNRLCLAVQKRSFAVLTGPPGIGKTAMLHALAEHHQGRDHQVVYVPFAVLDRNNIVRFLAQQLGLTPPRSLADTLTQIQAHLRRLRPLTLILIFDEVENLPISSAQIIRLIADAELNGEHLCCLLLAGSDAFLEQLRLQINEPLRQRITLYAQLRALSAAGVEQYVRHRLEQAGAHQQIFQPQALQLLHELCNGVPRLLNTVAQASLEAAAADQKTTVGLDDVEQAARTALLPEYEP